MIKTQKLNFDRYFPSLMTVKVVIGFCNRYLYIFGDMEPQPSRIAAKVPLLMSLFKCLMEFLHRKNSKSKKMQGRIFLTGERAPPRKLPLFVTYSSFP